MLKNKLKTTLITTVAVSALGLAGTLVTATPVYAAATVGGTTANSQDVVQTTTEAQTYGELVTINDQTIRQNHAEELTTPVIANPTTAESSQGGTSLAVVPAGIKTSWAAPQQLTADVAQPGNHQEGVVVAFSDGSTKTLGMALHVLGDEQETGQTKQSQLTPSDRAGLGNPGTELATASKNSSPLAAPVKNGARSGANLAGSRLITDKALANNQLPQTGVDQGKNLLSLALMTVMAMLGLVVTNRRAGKR